MPGQPAQHRLRSLRTDPPDVGPASNPGEPDPPGRRARSTEVFRVFLRLGCVCFGGPVAHLGYFHEEFVARRRWLGESAYANLVALCQFLPGPASSQVGMAIGYTRAGLPGLLAAWLGFTLPSAVIMIGLGTGFGLLGNDLTHAGWLRGLKLAAVAVVAQALWTMARQLCPDRARATVALAAAGTVLSYRAGWLQVAVIAAGAVAGSLCLGHVEDGDQGREREGADEPDEAAAGPRRPGRVLALAALGTFGALLWGLPALAAAFPAAGPLRVFSTFFRVGSLVFGGGHVVLPLLQAETADRGWITPDRFLAGYGAAQALPGPLFTFAGYLGAAFSAPQPHGWAGGLLGLAAIFLPSALLVVGTLPFWGAVRQRRGARAALLGANAAVVGLLLAAFYNPVWTGAVHTPREFLVAVCALGLLVSWRCPPWLVVFLAALSGQLLLN